jgi:hypothetical protein
MLDDIESNLLNIRVLAGLDDVEYQDKVNTMKFNAAVSDRGRALPGGYTWQPGR